MGKRLVTKSKSLKAKDAATRKPKEAVEHMDEDNTNDTKSQEKVDFSIYLC
jgi:hypothetical protein